MSYITRWAVAGYFLAGNDFPGKANDIVLEGGGGTSCVEQGRYCGGRGLSSLSSFLRM